jgi:hypothetical protein
LKKKRNLDEINLTRRSIKAQGQFRRIPLKEKIGESSDLRKIKRSSLVTKLVANGKIFKMQCLKAVGKEIIRENDEGSMKLENSGILVVIRCMGLQKVAKFFYFNTKVYQRLSSDKTSGCFELEVISESTIKADYQHEGLFWINDRDARNNENMVVEMIDVVQIGLKKDIWKYLRVFRNLKNCWTIFGK